MDEQKNNLRTVMEDWEADLEQLSMLSAQEHPDRIPYKKKLSEIEMRIENAMERLKLLEDKKSIEQMKDELDEAWMELALVVREARLKL